MARHGNNQTTRSSSGSSNSNRRSTTRNQHHQRGSPRSNGNGQHPARDQFSQAWLDAIENAGSCVRNVSGAYVVDSVGKLDVSLDYLAQLEKILTKKRKATWQYPPDMDPPKLEDFRRDRGGVASSSTPPNGHGLPVGTPPRPSPPSAPMPTFSAVSPNSVISTNPFAAFLDSDDDDDDDQGFAGDEKKGDDQDAGDEIVINYQAGGMDILRLFVRLSTSQSDLQAAKATILAQTNKEWAQGATCLQYAIVYVRKALELADAQISKWYENRNDDDDWILNSNSHKNRNGGNGLSTNPTQELQEQRQRDLMQDADIVHVTVQSLIDQRERYVAAARQQEARLLRRLRPKWQGRDEAMRKIGRERWTNNPNPKRDYAAMRLADEEELKKLQKALELMEAYDTHGLAASAKLLMTRLTSKKKNRYNGQRPTDDSKRVPGFVDATVFGWLFTGSADNVVEFFEKIVDDTMLVKLDFYFTTGTVKTSMEHPTQGKTQLFAKNNVTPELYMQILENPRVHTNIRYQRKPRK